MHDVAGLPKPVGERGDPGGQTLDVVEERTVAMPTR
jgi:hypothetical protein